MRRPILAALVLTAGGCVTTPMTEGVPTNDSPARREAERRLPPVTGRAVPVARTSATAPDVVGRPVADARRLAEDSGYLFVWYGGPDGVPLSAGSHRRVEVEVAKGVVVEARAFDGRPWGR